MPEKQDGNYRPINMEFLGKSGKLAFDIFTKATAFGETSYVKFADAGNPRHQEKVHSFLEAGDFEEEFFIHEEDLFKYYEHATDTLKRVMANSKVTVKEKTRKMYGVSKDIMKDFFEFSASSKILHSSEKVMEIMEDCMSVNEVGFGAIAQITNKDYYTYTHSVNVGLYCMTFGVKCQMPRNDIRDLGVGGMMHDVGKSKIPHEIINKNGQLTDEEFEVMKQHSPWGKEILDDMNCYGPNVVVMAAQHHEKFTGGGYPNNLSGESISTFARVCKIMDVYDALTTRRSYKKAMSAFDTLTLMRQKMGQHFDPKLLGDFIRLMGPDM